VLREGLSKRMAQLREMDYILLQFTDLLGLLRGQTIPARRVDRGISLGIGFDGSSVPGFAGIEEGDMIMRADPTTLTFLPDYFYDRKVASFICDIYMPGGKRFENDPRYICQRMVKKMREGGYEPLASAEVEFYLVKIGGDGSIRSVEEHVNDHQRYFDFAPGRDRTERYRMELSDVLSGMGFEVERFHHEVGPAQNEISFRYADPVGASDRVMRYKFAAKMVAERRFGWIATFMPKVWPDKAGSGMHVHLGLRSVDGENVFSDPNGYGGISQTCRYFIGGLLDHARALSAITAPTVNSYKRLVPGYEAPVYITWGKRNRSALVRVPEYFPGVGAEARIEFRCPDPLCNPYLAYTALFEAGMDGIKRKIDPGDPIDENVYKLDERRRRELGVGVLPRNLKEALEEWMSDDICIRALGKEVAEKFLELKMEEWREYQAHAPKEGHTITKWEIGRYLFV